MNTEQLKYLIEVSQSASISAASERLFMTPQALSIALKKLEDELGIPLLKRSYKGAVLTPDGIWLVELADQFLSAIEARQKQEAPSIEEESYSGDFDIAINTSGLGFTFFAQFICALAQKQPNFHVHLQERSKEELIAEVLEEKLEAALIFRTSYNGNYVGKLFDDLLFEPLFQGKHVVMASPEYDFTKFSSTTLKKIVKYPLCDYLSHKTFDWGNHFLTDICNLDAVKTTESNFSLFKEKLLQGLAVSISVQFEVEDYPLNYVEGLRIVPLRENAIIHFGILKKKGTVFSKNTAYFLTELRNFTDDLIIKKQRG